MSILTQTDMQPHPVIELADKAIEAWPANEARFRRAADLVADGKVEVLDLDWNGGWSGAIVGRVFKKGAGIHILRRKFIEQPLAGPRTQERWIVSCTCEDYQYMQAPFHRKTGQRWCKHVAAYRMAVQLMNEAGETPPTFEERQAQREAERKQQSRAMHAKIARQNAAYNGSAAQTRRTMQMQYANGRRSFTAETYRQAQGGE